MTPTTNTPLRNPPADYCPDGSARCFRIPDGLDAGKTLHYADIRIGEVGPSTPTVLFVHGNPESSYTYRHIRDALIAAGRPLRLVMPDHIGMGLSDQADFEMVEMHHAANLRQLVQALDLRHVVLVLHDWGGPIGVGALIDEPERVIALAILNTTVFPMPGDGLTYRNFPFPWLPWFTTARLIPDALWGGVAAAVVPYAEPQRFLSFLSLTTRWLWRHARRTIPAGTPEHVWSESFRTPANARSSKRNVRQTPVWGHGYRYVDARHGVQDNHAFYAHLQRVLPQRWGHLPACGHFGEWDACGKASVIAQWQAALPSIAHALHRYPTRGHFIEEHEGPAIAASLLALLPA